MKYWPNLLTPKTLWKRLKNGVHGVCISSNHGIAAIRYWVPKGCRWEIENVKPKENPGFILSGFKYLFAGCRLLSISKWINVKYQAYSTEEAREMKKLHIYKRVDWYAIIWIVIEIAMVTGILLAPTIMQNSMRIAALGFLSYRLFEIFQSWVGQFVLTYKWDPINANRALVLNIIAFLEIIILGSVVRFITPTHDSTTFWTALHSSIMAMIANPDLNDVPHAIVYTQIMLAVLFLTVVAQQVLARIQDESRKGVEK